MLVTVPLVDHAKLALVEVVEFAGLLVRLTLGALGLVVELEIVHA